ncbi:hypothetical protein GCM10010399_85180 [Dactylosporangium fulvum]
MFFVAAVECFVGALLIVLSTMESLASAATTLIIVGALMMVSAVVMVLIGMRLLKRYAEAKRLRETGVAGTAQVLRARQTGVSMNDQPQVELDLRVTCPGHGTYDVTRKEFVPLLVIGRLSLPVPLAVIVDAKDRQKVLIDWSGDAPVQVPFGMPRMTAPPVPQMDPAEAERAKQQILATGVPGVARVLSATFTGALDQQGRPVYSIQLHVQIEGREPIAGAAQVGVPVEHVSLMQPGGTIPIKADPYDPAKFAADWARTPAA